MCTFDFDLPNISSIDRHTVLCFSCWEKRSLGPSYEPGHRPSLHYPSGCWQVWEDESSTVRCGLDLITDVICGQLAVSTDHSNNTGYRDAHGWETHSLSAAGWGKVWTTLPKVGCRSPSLQRHTFQYGLHLSRRIRNVALLTLNLVVIKRYLTLDSKVCCVTENRMCVTLDNLSTVSSEALIPQLIYTDAKTVNITAIWRISYQAEGKEPNPKRRWSRYWLST